MVVGGSTTQYCPPTTIRVPGTLWAKERGTWRTTGKGAGGYLADRAEERELAEAVEGGLHVAGERKVELALHLRLRKRARVQVSQRDNEMFTRDRCARLV